MNCQSELGITYLLCAALSSGDLKRHKEQESTTVSHQCVCESVKTAVAVE